MNLEHKTPERIPSDALNHEQHGGQGIASGSDAWMTVSLGSDRPTSGVAMLAQYNTSAGTYMDLDMIEAADSETDYSSSSDDDVDVVGGGGGGGGSDDEGLGLHEELARASYCDIEYLRRSGVTIPETVARHKQESFEAKKPKPSLDDIIPESGGRSSSHTSQGSNRKEAEAAPDFYGKALDDENAAWMEKQKSKPGAKSDAVLCCPFCFTVLCYESKRHYKFAHQYFTRTTVNCEEDPTERLVYDEVQNRKNKRRRGKPRMARVAVPSSNQEEGAVGASDTSDVGAGGGKAPASAAATRNGEGAAGAGVAAATTTGKPKPEDVYIPVRCCTCSTEVGVRDCDGGTHLFNVLPSHESRAR